MVVIIGQTTINNVNQYLVKRWREQLATNRSRFIVAMRCNRRLTCELPIKIRTLFANFQTKTFD